MGSGSAAAGRVENPTVTRTLSYDPIPAKQSKCRIFSTEFNRLDLFVSPGVAGGWDTFGTQG